MSVVGSRQTARYGNGSSCGEDRRVPRERVEFRTCRGRWSGNNSPVFKADMDFVRRQHALSQPETGSSDSQKMPPSDVSQDSFLCVADAVDPDNLRRRGVAARPELGGLKLTQTGDGRWTLGRKSLGDHNKRR